MHAHLLPGIDDGAQTMEDTLRLVQDLKALGYHHLIATPHIFKEHYPNTSTIVRQKLAEVRAALAAANVDITLEAAAEYYLDEHFEDLLEQGDLLTFGNKHLLVEMSFYAPYPRLHEVVFALRTKGYRPILAHPERYGYYAAQFDQFEQIKNYGCELQVNLLSLSGYYGKSTKTLAHKLLDAGLVDYIGTDMHHAQHATAAKAFVQRDEWHKILSKHRFKNDELQTIHG